MELKSNNHKNLEQYKEVNRLFKICFFTLLPFLLLILSIAIGTGIRDKLTSRIESHFNNKGLYSKLDEIGLRKYIHATKEKSTYKNVESYSQKVLKGKSHWQLELLQSALSEYNLPFQYSSERSSQLNVDLLNNKQKTELMRILAVCELLDFSFCFNKNNFSLHKDEVVVSGFDKFNQSRNLLNILNSDKEFYHFFKNNIKEYLTTLKNSARILTNDAFRANIISQFESLKAKYSKKYPLLVIPSGTILLARAKKLSKLNNQNYYLLARDFNLTNELTRTTPKIRAFSLDNGHLRVDNLTNISQKISKIEMGKEELIINKEIPSSEYYSSPSSIYLKNNFQNAKKIKIYLTGDTKAYRVLYPYNESKKIYSRPYSENELKALGFEITNEDMKYKGSKLYLKKPIVNDSNKPIIFTGPVTVTLSPNSYLYSKAALVTGTFGKVIFKGEQNKLWGGILISEATSLSRVNNTIFESIKDFEHGDIKLTGAINFYRSDVSIKKTHFNNNKSEDMLNIINSKFNINNVHIVNTPSDAFDSDFSEGTISDSHFIKIGGDGFDVSGTKGTISNSQFIDINDKAISVGEASNITSIKNSIMKVGTGIASKDQSIATDSDSSFRDIRHSVFATYVKKPEYGVASIIVTNPTFSGVNKVSLVQNGSTLVLNGNEVKGEDINIKQIYDSGYMKK
tara:strand:- start:106551 stop:108599 length:2049 start_codon:yes stop_codon:yes gene_type:complete